ncbi:DUF397 domain-containing protein [Actinomadura craniellae]|uniref:DUF397 domain-containing protein n=1 Tax=Actinomadura craniellae TaxID=2231787 RepID=A0A365H4Q7_9ACTN|nr:DUF397 domain-containing protein [Actinomadura craniellae]RAY14090.1 DUF397 domain-containing protein [Actinomadura craniellae]
MGTISFRWTWRKSSRSAQGANCVEAARAGTLCAVRDSKSPESGILVVGIPVWHDLLRQVKAGVYDL